MSGYTAEITDTQTGETRERTYTDLGEWDDGAEYWWSDGNFGCDCNRRLEFGRAGGIEFDDWPCNEYGTPNRYIVRIKVKGAVVYDEGKE